MALPLASGARHRLGAVLARSQLEVVLATVTSRWRHFALAAGRDLRWNQRGLFRVLDESRVTTGDVSRT